MATKHFSRVWQTTLSLLALIATGFSVSCTRAVNQNVQISLSLPDSIRSLSTTTGTTTGSTSQLMHLAVNIPGGSPKSSYVWDANSGTPLNLTFTVANSSAPILIQVLAMYNTGAATFYYGDSLQPITADTTVNVTVNPFVVPSGNVIQQGSIGGQYVTSISGSLPTGPTGVVNIVYYPPLTATTSATKPPPILVGTSSMFNGYFEFFAIGGGAAATPVGFNYMLQDGSDTGLDLFANDVSGGTVDLSLFNAQSTNLNKTVNISVPAYWNQNGGNGSTSYSYNPPSNDIYGYFGTIASALPNSICYPPATQMYNYSAPSPTPVPTTTPGTAQLHWSGGVTPGGNPNVTISGGVYSSTTDTTGQNLCVTTGTRFANFLSVDPQNILNQNDSLGFTGPYVTYIPSNNNGNNNRSALDINSNGATLTVSYTYLPGVQAQGVTSAVYYRLIPSGNAPSPAPSPYPNPQDYSDSSGGILCDSLTKLPDTNGYAPIQFTPMTPLAGHGEVATTAQQTLVFDLPPTFVGGQIPPQDMVQLIVCPLVNGVSSANGVSFDAGSEFETTGGGGNNNNATQLQLADGVGGVVTPATSGTSSLNVQDGVCAPLVVSGLTSSGTPGNLYLSTGEPSGSFTGTVGGVLPQYFGGDDSCLSTSVAPLQFGNYPNGFYVVYVKNSGTGTGTSTLMLSDSVSTDGIMGTLSATINFAPIGSSPVQTLLYEPPQALYQYSCYPYSTLQAARSASGTLTQAQAFSSAPMFTLPTITGLSYYSNSNCSGTALSTPPTQMTYNFALNSVTNNAVYFMYTGTAPSLSLAPVSSSNFTGGVIAVNGPASTPVVTPGAATGAQFFNTNNNPTIGTGTMYCNPVQVQLQDSNGHASPAATGGFSGTVSLSGSVGLLYSSPSCAPGTGQSSLAFTVAAGQTLSNMLYYAATVTGSDSLQIKNASNNNMGSTTITPQPQYMVLITAGAQVPRSGPIVSSVPEATCTGGSSGTDAFYSGQCTNAWVLTPVSNFTFNFNVYQTTDVTTATPSWTPANTFNATYTIVAYDTASQTDAGYPQVTFVNGVGSAPFTFTSTATYCSSNCQIQFTLGGGTWTTAPANFVQAPSFTTNVVNPIYTYNP